MKADPHAEEVTREISRDKYSQLLAARAAVTAWKAEVERVTTELELDLGEATAGTIDGQKVIAHRWKDSYAVARLREEYPDLTSHFVKMVAREEFVFNDFAAAHEDIVAKYRTRAFTVL